MSGEDLAATSNFTLDRWVNLFYAADRARVQEIERVKFPEDDIDSLVKSSKALSSLSANPVASRFRPSRITWTRCLI